MKKSLIILTIGLIAAACCACMGSKIEETAVETLSAGYNAETDETASETDAPEPETIAETESETETTKSALDIISEAGDSDDYDISEDLNVHISEGTALFDTKYFELYMPTSVDWDYEVVDDRTISFYYTVSRESGNGGWVGSLMAYAENDETYKDFPAYKVAGISADGSETYIYLLPTDVQFGENERDGYNRLMEHMRLIDIENYQNPLYLPGVVREESSTADSEYILPHSNDSYLTEDDIRGLSSDEISLAINEIYARHGRIFNDDEIRAYFESKSWYQGTVSPDDFSDSIFNDYELKNITFLQENK